MMCFLLLRLYYNYLRLTSNHMKSSSKVFQECTLFIASFSSIPALVPCFGSLLSSLYCLLFAPCYLFDLLSVTCSLFFAHCYLYPAFCTLLFAPCILRPIFAPCFLHPAFCTLCLHLCMLFRLLLHIFVSQFSHRENVMSTYEYEET